MSRSYRKTPKIGIAADSDKADKQLANRRLRKSVKDAIQRGEEILPELKEVSDEWGFSKDGKTRFDPDEHPDLMRK